MSSLFQRMYALGLEKIPIYRRQQLGKIVKEKFFSQEKPRGYHIKEQKEGTETFQVIHYPKSFTQDIDQIIKDFCIRYDFDLKPREPRPFRPKLTIETPPEPVEYVSHGTSLKPKRKRQPIKAKPVYSTKSYKK
jgi:hypothetical protein